MKVLVTGGTGFLGSKIVALLLEQGHHVRVLRRTTSRLDLLGEHQHHVEHALGDITDPESLPPAMAGIEQVYHTAAYVSLNGKRDAEKLHRINVEGTAHVVNAALRAGVQRLVHTSSIAAVGRPEKGSEPIDEATPWTPSRNNSHYARSKYAAEREVQRGVAEGLDAVLVNPSLIFGLARPGENSQQIAERVRDGQMPAYPSGATNVVDVLDVAEGHLRAMAHGQTGERYLLAGDNMSWRDIIDTLAQAMQVPPPKFVLPTSVALLAATAFELLAVVTRGEPFLSLEAARNAGSAYTYDNSKAVAVLGCTFRPFVETAARMAAALT